MVDSPTEDTTGAPATDPGAGWRRPGPVQGGRRKGSGPHAPSTGLTPQAIRAVAGIVVGLLVAGGLTGVLLRRSQGGTQRRPAATVPVPGASDRALPATDAELMGLSSMKDRPAAGFTLTDQVGRRLSLAQLDAKRAVVLTFFDDRCTDICPIVAHEIATADASLGSAARKVAFVAVNVNPLHTSVAAVRAFTVEHGLGGLPNFYYLTGPVPSLRRVWAAYQVTVRVEQPQQVVLHTDTMYFLAPGGRMRYQATPFANERANGTGWLPAATMGQWSSAIATYARLVLR